MQKLHDEIKAYCEANHISGMLRITSHGRILLRQSFGYADHSEKTPFDDKSMFSLYSLSKPFCAIGLLKLFDAGLVDIDAHPGRYLPELVSLDGRVTLRHLLQHISGLADPEQDMAGFTALGVREHALLTDYVAALPALPLHFAPGEGKLYANINYNIPALIIERVSGMSYAEYMKKEVFEPLGMHTAVVDREGLEIPRRVKGYEWSGAEMVAVPKAMFGMLGAGDIVATVDDVYCLGLAIKHGRLLQKNTWEQILTPSPLNRMGMGCTVLDRGGQRWIRHNGGHTGFRTLHEQYPADDLDIVLLTNSGFGRAREDIFDLIHARFYGKGAALGERVAMDAGYIPHK